MDSAGEFITRVGEQRPEWEPVRSVPGQAFFKHHKDPIVAEVGNLSLAVSYRGTLKLVDAASVIEKFSLAAEYFYEAVASVIRSKRTERLGVVFVFDFPAGSVEEADRFVVKGTECPFSALVAAESNARFVDVGANFFFASEGSSVRRSFTFNSTARNRKPGSPPLEGFPVTEGDGAVQVTVDNFTRLDTGHQGKLRMFTQDRYAESKSIAVKIMQTRVRS